ncbi:DsbA family protein [Phaeocystidibacter marisrubri]|uniref:DsbA family protein n=1 Tax=Phaeocystidibacter marisrubri TaxID=1577780 RepID=A0A6L3ZF71_9FLAO|nr:hypothetical protein [Phaeocystidibacter marisrubri]KAB2816218.1 hypothetical protein F8C82_11060 [Phaeocystidibacter marisrubri]GGH67910.1 DsbA family protein [Phaeocystidibacter marisrubri]
MRETRKFIYVFDPLCAWCHVFGEKVIAPLQEAYGDFAQIDIFAGGLYVGDRVGLLGSIAANYPQAIAEIEAHAGYEFSDAFKENVLSRLDEFEMNSEHSGAAFAWLKQHVPERQVEIAHGIQKLFFEEGLSLSDAYSYRELVEGLGLNFEPFKAVFYSPETVNLVRQQYIYAHQLGVRSFPSLIYVHGSKGELLAQGFREFLQIDSIMKENFYRM